MKNPNPHTSPKSNPSSGRQSHLSAILEEGNTLELRLARKSTNYFGYFAVRQVGNLVQFSAVHKYFDGEGWFEIPADFSEPLINDGTLTKADILSNLYEALDDCPYFLEDLEGEGYEYIHEAFHLVATHGGNPDLWVLDY